MHFLEEAIVLDRRLVQRLGSSKLRCISRRIETLLLRDATDINGFNPPRALRCSIAFFIAAENVLVTVIPWSDEAISARSMASQAGRLCFMNMLPLCLLVIPGNGILPRTIRQCREQWLWAHSFFGWSGHEFMDDGIDGRKHDRSRRTKLTDAYGRLEYFW
ncbi:hypothetical protein CABS01_17067 [Colletotrichum abscissum]|uniref:uncharacterized protein n=1 Tax=Colletotrichum abscissum TaxID=1671311 RepID=UPI0027D61AA8|nr:uncharacterized protein CABS01_17067 [Colletotrichum abscissum]KAK1494741.1 hypothetical protein CABS01_17067 [Colletotrichum abscissum]